MKFSLSVLIFLIAASVFAQEKKARFTDQEHNMQCTTQQDSTSNTCPQLYVEDLQTPDLWIEQAWPENGIVQPTQINELPNGTMPLNKDLPFVHTIRGYVYTADYLRYMVR